MSKDSKLADLPEPMNSKDIDLRGSEWMPLPGREFFKGEFYDLAFADPRAGLAGLKLWWEAWNQCPAGSLPNDDHQIARMADYGRDVRGWLKVKAIALHGFILCSDGRLYHPTISALAAAKWRQMIAERDRKRTRNGNQTSEWSILRKITFQRDGYRCVYCDTPTNAPHCDHATPITRGGKTTLDNLATACPDCNLSKGARTLDEWRSGSNV